MTPQPGPGRVRAVGVAAGVPSPCISVCRMNAASGLCEGCSRTLAEIATWASLDDAGKRTVWQNIEQRRAAAACPPEP